MISIGIKVNRTAYRFFVLLLSLYIVIKLHTILPYIVDFLINTQMLSSSSSQYYNNKLHIGKDIMSKSSVSILGVARNIKYIDLALNQVDRLASKFKKSRAIFVEGLHYHNHHYHCYY